MRVQLVVADRGFTLCVNERNFDVARHVIFGLVLYLESGIKEWSIERDDLYREGICQFIHSVKGCRTGWRFQGPFQRIG